MLGCKGLNPYSVDDDLSRPVPWRWRLHNQNALKLRNCKVYALYNCRRWKNISLVIIPSVFYSSLIFSLINAFFAIYTSKAETTFSSKKTFASSSSAWNTHRFLKIVWYGRVFWVDIFAFRYIQNEIVIFNH